MLKYMLAAIATYALVHGAQAADMGAKDEPIRLAVNEGTASLLTIHAGGEMLRRAGYKVEYVTAGYSNQFQPIGEGELHASLQIWSSNVPQAFEDEKKAGRVVDIGELGLEAREGFAYPVHVEEICPGLPDWKAMEACASKFATADTLQMGRFLDYPAEWGTPGADRVAALKLPYKAVSGGSEGAMIAELRAAVAKKSPLLMIFWRPHWLLSELDVKFVDLPKPDPACYTDKAWGTNPEVTGDCDFQRARVFKVVWSGFEKKWPAAYEILSKFKLNNEQHQILEGKIANDKVPVETAIAEWMAANESSWRPILEDATAQ